MNVTGPGSPAYSASQRFTVRNTGEANAGPLFSATLSNTTYFQFHSGGTYVGDNCGAKTLAHNQTCIIDLRARSSGDGSYSGTLNVTGDGITAQATLNGSATGWTCNLPWGGTITAGNYVTAYQTSSVPYGNSCASEQRTCGAGGLSGSYTYQSCAPQAPAACTLPWGGTLAHGSSVTAYQTSTVPYGNTCTSGTIGCSNGSLTGSGYTHQNCAPAAPANCASAPGGALAHGQTRRYYIASSVPCGGTCSYEDRTCNNGTLPGSYTATSCGVEACGGTWVRYDTKVCGAGVGTMAVCTSTHNPCLPLGSRCKVQLSSGKCGKTTPLFDLYQCN